MLSMSARGVRLLQIQGHLGCALERRLPQVILAVALWFLVIFAPLACIIHCHMMPWFNRHTSPAAVHHNAFLCDFTGGEQPAMPASHTSSLPRIVYELLAVAGVIALAALTFIGATPRVAQLHLPQWLNAPLTPPPRLGFR